MIFIIYALPHYEILAYAIGDIIKHKLIERLSSKKTISIEWECGGIIFLYFYKYIYLNQIVFIDLYV